MSPGRREADRDKGQACRGLQRLLWAGVAFAVTWCSVVVLPAFTPPRAGAAQPPQQASASAQVDRVEQRIWQTEQSVAGVRESLAGLREAMVAQANQTAQLRQQVDGMAAQQTKVLLGVVGVFLNIIGALVALIWSLRRGWITTGGGA